MQGRQYKPLISSFLDVYGNTKVFLLIFCLAADKNLFISDILRHWSNALAESQFAPIPFRNLAPIPSSDSNIISSDVWTNRCYRCVLAI